MSNNNKILFFDIDGTLINFKGVMPASTKLALKLARENGHKLIICSGRSRAQMHDWLVQLPFDGFVCASGAYVEYEGKVISNHYVTEDALRKFVSYTQSHAMIVCLQAPTRCITNKQGVVGLHQMFREKLGDSSDVTNKLIDATIVEENLCACTDIEKMIYYQSSIPIKQIREALAPEFEVAASSFEEPDETSGEVTMTGIHKAFGMQQILKHLHMDQVDTIAFGDGPCTSHDPHSKNRQC